ncbi:hypothetical protein BD289DRAFT_423863 [Coniella lustricola]|uniref:Uncharacterized protein n=1 Tax=Coniella lustricola TaxID=2025994 RepID=A0A2T3AJ39_9PEZI|nr:hypothetical protein BD289DRAFT_423863 [Coniella lustricola]
MEQLPSYREAVNSDGWTIVAHSINVGDLYRLCLVSTEFNARFAPRLWKDPLRMIIALGIHPGRERRWFLNFISMVCRSDQWATRDSTLAMIMTIDLRVFRSLASPYSYSVWPDMTQELYKLVSRLSNLRCLVLDGYTNLDFTILHQLLVRKTQAQTFANLNVLSMANCMQAIPAKFFGTGCLAGLVYLDLSYTGGWARNLLMDPSFTSTNLPKLRVLKLRGKSLDSLTAAHILQQFAHQLWSLDLSNNNGLLSHSSFLALYSHWAAPDHCREKRLQTSQHFDVEGKLRAIDSYGRADYLIDESPWSAAFSHPHRYLTDAPAYLQDPNEDGHNHQSVPPCSRYNRLSGAERLRSDSLDDAILEVAGSSHDSLPVAVDMLSPVPRPSGLTHVYLNDTSLPLGTIKSWVSSSTGWVEHLECENGESLPCSHPVEAYLTRLTPVPSQLVPKSCYGLPCAAYLFRPVISSNLRALRTHHSLVTNVPTIRLSHRIKSNTNIPFSQKRDLLNTLLAETCCRARFDLATPQRFVPDMNPRIHSLSLCHIPRTSTGVTTQRLIEFLKLAAAQEHNIALARSHTTPAVEAQVKEETKGQDEKRYRRFQRRHHRAPPLLRGIRRIVFEFETDLAGVEGLGETLDAEEELLAESRRGTDVASAMEEFSSFSENAWNTTIGSVSQTASPTPSRPRTNVYKDDEVKILNEGRPSTRKVTLSSPRSMDLDPSSFIEYLIGGPYDDTEADYVQYSRTNTPTDNNSTATETTSVWIGCGVLHPANPPAVNSYMRNISLLMPFGTDPKYNRNICHTITLATPSHIVAGVPAKAYIFDEAWDAMMVPTQEEVEEAVRKADNDGSLSVEEGGKQNKQSQAKESSRQTPETHHVFGIAAMRDVLEDLKTFRLASRDRYMALLNRQDTDGGIGKVEEHWYWTGRLDIVMTAGKNT